MPDAFHDLPLAPALLDSLDKLGFSSMTAVQAAALPALLAGRDVVGQAATGSGKTAAFGLCCLQRLDRAQRVPQALVLCPTRELAEQVTAALRELASSLSNTRIVSATGGHPIFMQARQLSQGAHVVVGTPGRVAALLAQGSLAVDALRCVVLDEADRMLDMGFSEQVMHILEQLPTQRQTALFSATFPDTVRALSSRTQQSPVVIVVESLHDHAVLQQEVYFCEPSEREDLVCALLATHQPARALLFCHTRRQTVAIAALITERGGQALPLSGELDQRQRDDALARFSGRSVAVLVATDVAARGLDISDLELVINVELPRDPEIYIHRIGRTARAGQTGQAISVVAGREARRLSQITERTNTPIPEGPPLRASGLDLSALVAPNVTLLILGGRRNRLRAGDILGAITAGGKVPGDAVGDITLTDRRVWVAVRRAHAAAALKVLRGQRIKKQRFRVVLLA